MISAQVDNTLDQQVHDCLAHLIQREQCVLCYDRDLIDQLPDILAENHQIHDGGQAKQNRHVANLFQLLDPSGSCNHDPSRLPALIRQSTIDTSRYVTRGHLESQAAQDFSKYSTADANQDRQAVLALQHDLGQNIYRDESERCDPHLVKEDQIHQYINWVSTVRPTRREKRRKSDFWGLQIKKWVRWRRLALDLPSLSVGPRWLSEILYFRQVHGLTQHIGLDLHSSDPELVVEGDMHQMPFSDHHFGFLFIKNTVDKSYDVRQLVKEVTRVVRPGGIVAVDQICSQGQNTILTRTDIQNAENFLRLVRRQANFKVLVSKTIDVSGQGDAASTSAKRNNVRLAIQLRT